MSPDNRESLMKERKNAQKSGEKQTGQYIDSSYSEIALNDQPGTRWKFNRRPSNQFKVILLSSTIQSVLELQQNHVV